MDVLEELKKTRLMVLARGVSKDVLLKAALSVLALMPAENVQAFDSLTTRWTFGAHEPITMYRRKGGRTTGGIEGSSKWVASWLDWFDTESPKLMKELGLNWCHCRFYKGMGWKFEKRDFPNVKRFVDAAHANGVRTLAYIQFMTLYYENMLAEIPNLRDWAARDHEGKMMYYYGGGYYRWVPCISCDEWIDYLVPIMRFAVFSLSVTIFWILPPSAVSMASSYFFSVLIRSATTPRIPGSRLFCSITLRIEPP